MDGRMWAAFIFKKKWKGYPPKERHESNVNSNTKSTKKTFWKNSNNQLTHWKRFAIINELSQERKQKTSWDTTVHLKSKIKQYTDPEDSIE